MTRSTHAVLIVLVGWTLASLSAAHADQVKSQGVVDMKAGVSAAKRATKPAGAAEETKLAPQPVTKPAIAAEETKPAPQGDAVNSSVQKKLSDTTAGQQQNIR
jgi:hypothetical protein